MTESKELTIKRQEELNEIGKLIDLHGTEVQLSDDDTIADNPLVALTDMERAWVEAFAALAGSYGAATKAARWAGYAPGTEATKGSQNLRKKRVIKALKYLAETKAHHSALMAMNTLAELTKTGTDAIRLRAADRLLGYAGIIVSTLHRHEHEITDSRDEAEIEKAVIAKAQELGIPIGQLIDATPVAPPNPDGAPPYKTVLAPNRELSDEEIDEIDWSRVEVNTK